MKKNKSSLLLTERKDLAHLSTQIQNYLQKEHNINGHEIFPKTSRNYNDMTKNKIEEVDESLHLPELGNINLAFIKSNIGSIHKTQ